MEITASQTRARVTAWVLEACIYNTNLRLSYYDEALIVSGQLTTGNLSWDCTITYADGETICANIVSSPVDGLLFEYEYK